MSANSILSLKSVCEDYNIADDVVRIIMEYVKSHTFKHKINIQFLNGFNTMMEDTRSKDPADPGPNFDRYVVPRCFYEIMEEWGVDGVGVISDEHDSIDVQYPMNVDWDWVIRQVTEPVFRIPVGNDGRHLVSTITDFMETGGENCDG